MKNFNNNSQTTNMESLPIALSTSNEPKNYETDYVKNVYNKIAHHFDVTRTYKWSWITSFMESLAPESYICDLGCGNGRNMDYDGFQFVGVDNCEAFVNMCNKKGLNCKLGEMTNIPLESESVDAILSIASFHHLSSLQTRIEAMDEMHRILKPNGKILLSVWSKEQPKKTKRVFEKYGDNLVKWKTCEKVFERYYYIFQILELEILFDFSGFSIESHIWDCGNEIFVLSKK